MARIDTRLDWEDDAWLAGSAVPEELKHAYRVAALVRELSQGGRMHRAISLDTFNLVRCGYGIGNGHHRIRALRFLGVPCAPFSLSGSVAALQRLLKTAACTPAQEFARYFEPGLLAHDADDLSLQA